MIDASYYAGAMCRISVGMKIVFSAFIMICNDGLMIASLVNGGRERGGDDRVVG